ncbi:flagellar biosynthetic protein FliR [Micromonospora pattaloongensis]|uniref:Flagellar biosynthetic protein FliR n=1 Tax=Micromonospora pattaloongensis TaxID=405436 RepID=A0A1H3MY53_9ACTN|nr:flagellar biosynthetic protein FliR [Micromonospora pattaloongensis]SDY81637.1 flagellar biosynthetic protein FliR [Micromonospora pattaloongensis]
MTWQVPTASLLALLLATVRASAWLVVCPPFQGRVIPAQVKPLLALALALPVTPDLVDQAPAATAPALLVSTAEQVVVGVALGFLTALFFAAIQLAGDLIDLFGGFSVAFAFDPMSNASSSVFGRFYNLVAVTLLFASDGHQMVLRGFLQSYRTLPLDGTLSLANLSRLLTEGMGDMFMAGLQIAGPLIAVLFITDIALGLLNRVAPALNAFALGFPLKIFLTVALAGTAIAVLPNALDNLIRKAVQAVVGLSGG